MKVKYTPTALKHLAKIATYIDDINTRGSGERWIIRFDSFIKSYALQNTTYAAYKHYLLSKYHYQCIVIAFTITDNSFEVKRIIYGPHLA